MKHRFLRFKSCPAAAARGLGSEPLAEPLPLGSVDHFTHPESGGIPFCNEAQNPRLRLSTFTQDQNLDGRACCWASIGSDEELRAEGIRPARPLAIDGVKRHLHQPSSPLQQIVTTRYYLSWPPLVETRDRIHSRAVTVDQLQNLLERLGALLRAEQRVSGLPSAQFEALRYLAICNRYSNGPAAVADYLQISPGSASQSLQALEKKGLIQRQASSEDGRRLHQRLTRKGRRTLDRTAPSELLANTLEAMPKNVATRLCRDLESLLRSAQRERGGASFGLCRTCAHFRREDSGRFRCGLTGEVLSTEDSEFICREHRVVESS